MRPTLTIEVYRREDGRWDWRAQADNGEIVATSHNQGYENRGDAVELTRNLFGGHYHVDTVFVAKDGTRTSPESGVL